MSEYLIVLILTLIFPLVLSFYPPLRFYRRVNIFALINTIILILVIFGMWDVFATLRGHWYFNENKVFPIRIFNLPFEEILFFILIPFCCIFTWETIKYIKGTFEKK